MFKKKWMLVSMMGGLALVLAVVGVGLFGQTNIVSAARSNVPFSQGGPGGGPGFSRRPRRRPWIPRRRA